MLTFMKHAEISCNNFSSFKFKSLSNSKIYLVQLWALFSGTINDLFFLEKTILCNDSVGVWNTCIYSLKCYKLKILCKFMYKMSIVQVS